MPQKIAYQQQLLRAVHAFMKEDASSLLQAHLIIQRCLKALNTEEKLATLDDIVWGFFIRSLNDSVFFENREFLQKVLDWLHGNDAATSIKAIFYEDYRPSFQEMEAEWYHQLLHLAKFLTDIPYTKIQEATALARQNNVPWETMCQMVPEAARAELLEEEYERRKSSIQSIIDKIHYSHPIGDEKMYQMVLRNVTDMLLEMRVGKAAVYSGVPVLDGSYSIFGDSASPWIDGTATIHWATQLLEGLAGTRPFMAYIRPGKGDRSTANWLVVSLYTL